MEERELLQNFIVAKTKKEQLQMQLDDAEKALAFHEGELIVYLNNRHAKKTAEYIGVGHATAAKPRITRAYYPKEYEPEMFDFVRKCQMGDIIKLQIHPSSLCSFLQKRLESLEDDIPGFVFMDSIQKLRMYKDKPKKSIKEY